MEVQKREGWGVREGFESDWAFFWVGKMQDLDMWRLDEEGSQSLHERKDQIRGHNKYIHPFSKYVLNLDFVLSTDISPGAAVVNRIKFLLSWSLCSSLI